MEQYLEVAVGLIILCGAIWTIVKLAMREVFVELHNIREDHHKDMQNIRSDMSKVQEEQKTSRLRTDHLYEMVCKLFSENKRA